MMETHKTFDLQDETTLYPAPTPYPSQMRGGSPRDERRRPGRNQGHALEQLGHAVEYLIDSRMFLTQVPYTTAEEEAVQILMSLSRLVFDGCPRAVTMRRRVLDGLMRLMEQLSMD